MGGFVFDMADDVGNPEGPVFLPAGNTRVTITSVGIRFLMKHHPDIIPDLSKSSITDRTRASSLGKAILLAQITWFCTNCAARVGQGLPLSLLEITTVAHSLCTLLTYLLWWSKPLNVAEPTVIRGEEAREACALMAMLSPEEKYMLFGTVSIQFPAEMASVEAFVADPEERSSLPSASPPRSPSPPVCSEDWETSEKNDSQSTSEAFISVRPAMEAVEGTNLTPTEEACKTP